MRKMTVLVGAAALGVMWAAPAWGHAKFTSPSSVPGGTDQPVVMQVPEERGSSIHTSRVAVGVPAGFTALSCEPKPDWTCHVEASADGEPLVSFTRTAGTAPDPLFEFVLRIPAQAGDHPFKVAQTYSDGQVVIWDGPPGSDTPAAVLEVTAAAAPATTATTAAAPTSAPATPSTTGPALEPGDDEKGAGGAVQDNEPAGSGGSSLLLVLVGLLAAATAAGVAVMRGRPGSRRA